MKLGLVGYGFGGRIFHTPFIQAASGIELAGVVARSTDKIAQVVADLPGVPVFTNLAKMIDAGGCDAVTITTPPATHLPLALQAIDEGLHVICDKPFAPTLRAAAQLVAAANEKGVVLNVFQNRRRDTDIVTLAALIENGDLGQVQRIHNRMDFNQIQALERGPTGGLLRDIGSHLVDQMLWLLGPAVSFNAQVFTLDLPEGLTDSGFVIHLRHVNGAESFSSATKTNHLDAREIRVYGGKGAYVVQGSDVQAREAIAGKRPIDDPFNWGQESESAWGTLHVEDGVRRVPSLRSNYSDFYTEFAHAVAVGSSGPVPARQSLRTVEVLDAARLAASNGQTVLLNPIIQQTDTSVDWRTL
jgi:predicted dehydrogenase